MSSVCRSITRILLAAGFLLLAASSSFGQSEPDNAAFDNANRLYETGQYEEAAAVYQSLLNNGTVSPSLLFNLGNAYFKSDQIGHAIVAWRRAKQLMPRDTSLRENLRLARNQVANGPPPSTSIGEFLHVLTMNEWMAAASITLWLLFGILFFRECSRRLDLKLKSATKIAAAIFLIVLIPAVYSVAERLTSLHAVVVDDEAVIRYGPLSESQSAFSVSDGYEFRVTDMKGNWLAVEDSGGRKGWVYQDQIQLLGGTFQ